MTPIQILDIEFKDELPTKEGNYPVKRKEGVTGWSVAQIVRVYKYNNGLMCSGPNWPIPYSIKYMPFLWGPKIEIQLLEPSGRETWY